MRHRRLALAGSLVSGLLLTACSGNPYELPQDSPTPASSEAGDPAAAAASVASPAAESGATRSPQAAPKPKLPMLKGDRDNAFGYAPLSDPDDVTIVGHVDDQRAWSTSKVLVMLAYIDVVADGDPKNLSAADRDLIRRALTSSDMDALLTIRGRIPGGSGAPMTAILRSIGDTRTTAPDSSEGSMTWSVRNQLRFMAALADGEVVSPAASRYILRTMKPIPEHSWGLGRIGASSFKGGWLEPYTDTRQMGIVDGYAVAIITDGTGPAVLQTDGDSAHVKQMNKLARMLKRHLDAQSN